MKSFRKTSHPENVIRGLKVVHEKTMHLHNSHEADSYNLNFAHKIEASAHINVPAPNYINLGAVSTWRERDAVAVVVQVGKLPGTRMERTGGCDLRCFIYYWVFDERAAQPG